MRSSNLRRVAAAAAGAVFLVVFAATAQAAGPNGPGRHVMPGTRPSWTAAVPQAAVVPSAELVHAKVWLAPRNAAQLDSLAQAVSDPSSSQFGQFISDDQFQAQFAPTAAQVAQVSQWLTKAGLSIDAVGPDNGFLAVSGGAAAANAAFGTQLGTFVVAGQQTQAPTSDLSVPDALSDSVLAVTGLSTLGHKVTPADFGPEDAFVNATPCSAFYGQQVARNLPKFQGKILPFAVCGYTPDQLRGAYGVDNSGGGYSFQALKGGGGGNSAGQGVTVAITDAYDSPRLQQDANTYSTRHGDRPFSHGQFVDKSAPEDASTGDACGGNGWYGEQTLDVEAVHGMAQGANVYYYGAASCFDDDLLAAMSQAVHDNKASIVTNSWGEPTFIQLDDGSIVPVIDQSEINAYEALFKHAAVQGIGFYFSSGDNGDELDTWGYAHPDWPAGDPWVTAVGGTSLAIGRNDNRLFETGWGTEKYGLSSDGSSWNLTVPFLYGAGGGYSQVFNRPAYQRGVVPSGTTGRAVPDVAMDGDPTTGMLIGETQNFSLPSRFGPAGVHYGEYRVGGTSLSSPLFAGVQAVAQSGAGRRIGFANPFIYAAFRGHVYYDVTPQGDAGNVRADYANGQNADGGVVYSVRTFDQDSSLFTAPGWDDVTGVGSVTARYFDAFPGGH
ncbi:MAG TPA: S53 family peptidase [Gaiellaceae bacterium]|nr:S53 family peptidase [Gaiellaceae bacterium]